MSYQIAKIAGVPIKVHWTFGLLLLFVLHVAYSNNYGLQDTLWYISIVLIVFVFVIMHEFGHIFVARKYGVNTKDVIVSPIGGVARLLSMPRDPKKELFIAIGGPAVNIFLAIILLIILFVFFDFAVPEDDRLNLISKPGEYLTILLFINVALVAFNMIPAFPMDGGRVFRALLTKILNSRLKATFIASVVGQLLAVVFLFAGKYFEHYMLMLIGVFIFFMARREYRQAKLEDKLDQTKVSDIMKPVDSIEQAMKEMAQGTIPQHLSLSQAFEVLSKFGWYKAIVYGHDNLPIGYVDRPTLMAFIDNNRGRGLF